MTPERWQQIDKLMELALEQEASQELLQAREQPGILSNHPLWGLLRKLHLKGGTTDPNLDIGLHAIEICYMH